MPHLTLSETELNVIDFGLAQYETIWQQQKELVQKRLNGEIPDTLMLGEHHPVITAGRGTHAANILNPTVPVVKIERGGDITYHGPGQLVIYPIIYLKKEKQDLHQYLRDLEEMVIQVLKAYEVEGYRNPGWTGVWVKNNQNKSNQNQDKKIASIGVAVKKWVTYHGIAFNVSTDLSHFHQINPCGLESHVMTSLSELITNQKIDIESLKECFYRAFKESLLSRV